MKNYQELRKITLGTSLRQLADQVTSDAERIYTKFDFNIDAKWFPVFYVLASEEANSVVNIAKIINHSHVSVSNIIKEMKGAGLIDSRKSKRDSRISHISLSDKANKMIPAMQQQCAAVDKATDQLLEDTGIDLLGALETNQRHLQYLPLSARIDSQNEAKDIRLIDYAPKYQESFRQLNIDWISKHWELEEPDLIALDNPETYILNKGGAIVIALLNATPVGCCALIKKDSQTFELAKMTVSEAAQGKGIGYLLGLEVLKRAELLGAQRLYLESNDLLKPALNLYSKLGFQHIQGATSPYERCNIQMEKYLDI